MAREVVTKCDKCGQPGEDVKTYIIRQDGETWEVDLDDDHAKPLRTLIALGRPVQTGLRAAGESGNRTLDRRIRNAPQGPSKE